MCFRIDFLLLDSQISLRILEYWVQFTVYAAAQYAFYLNEISCENSPRYYAYVCVLVFDIYQKDLLLL